MKNQFTSRIVKLTFAFMFVLLASSCNDDNETLDAAALAKETNEIAAKGAKLSTQSTFKDSEVILPSCLDCINERVLFEDNTIDAIGSSGKIKEVNYQIWNTATQLIVQTTSNKTTDKVLIVVNGITYTNDPLDAIPVDQVLYTYFPLPEGYDACEFTLESVRVDGGGQQADLTGIDYGVYVYCPEGCTNELSAVLTCGETRTATFTFTAEEAGEIVIQGGLTNGTTIISATSNVLTRNTTHPGVINSTANVTRWEGNVTACEVVTITIEYTGGNGIGSWSAKRGDSVLGSTVAKSCN